MPITPTLVRYLNGSSEYTYMTASPELKENHIGSPLFALLIGAIGITPEMYIIEQQLNYQPILNSTTRMLEGPSTFGRNLDTTTQTVEEDKNDGFLYTTFFIMAQLGGFYSFLKLVFGSVFNKIYEHMLLVDLLNRFRYASAKNTAGKTRRYQQQPRAQIHEEEKKLPNDNQDIESSILKEGGRSFARSNEPNDHDQLIGDNHIRRSRSNLIDQKTRLEDYTYMQAIVHSFKCKQNTRVVESVEDSYENRVEQFERDLNRFNHEADIINLMMSIKDTKYAINNVISTVVQLSESIESMHANNESGNSVPDKSQKNQVKVTQNQVPRMKNKVVNDEAVNDGAKFSKADTFAAQSNKAIEKANTQKDVKQQNNANLTKVKTVKVDADGNKVPNEQIKNINKIISDEINQIMNESKNESQVINQILSENKEAQPAEDNQNDTPQDQNPKSDNYALPEDDGKDSANTKQGAK